VGLTPVAERAGTYGFGYSWSNDVFNTLTGGSIGQVLWRRTGGSTDKSHHYDHIGNVIAEANTSGVVTLANEQDAYGRPILSSAGGWSDNSLHQTTKPWDDGSELFYFNARWYDGQLGWSVDRGANDGGIADLPSEVDRSGESCPGSVCNRSNAHVVIAFYDETINVWTGVANGYSYRTIPPGCCTGASEDWDFVYTPPRGWFKIPGCATATINGPPNSETVYWVDMHVNAGHRLFSYYGYNHGPRGGPPNTPPRSAPEYTGCRAEH